ncbi:MAG TPA: LytTR family DNA-binding domain-containing protein, partial [Vineibacter sp.]|nr:LytTR family DNA-binding domain-containing protein [Vineibacter sp.]
MTAGDALAGWPWYVLVFAGLGVLCAFLGPFGTFSDMTPLARLAYWLSIFVVNCLQVLAALALLARLTKGRWSLPALAAGASLLASVPATAEVAVLESLLRSNDHAGNLADIFTKVLVLTLAVTIPGLMIRARLAAPASSASPPAVAGPDGTALLKRVKPEMRGDLWALQMEDHYLRVHTSNGSDLILHRLSDALVDVAGLEGLQVHRSYWVARAAVAAADRDGRRLVLVL